MKKLAFALAFLAMALPSSALAQSAVDQYVEQVPGAGGDTPSGQVGNGGSGSDGSDGAGSAPTISPSTRDALEQEGADGAAVAALAEATAPSDRGRPNDALLPAASANSDEGQSAASAVLEALTGGGSGGMGAALPILLVGLLAGAIAFTVVGRRRSAGR